jgi:hypothetical protein
MGLYALLFVSSPVLVSEAMTWIRRLADAPKSNPSQKVEEWEPQRTKEASTLGVKRCRNGGRTAWNVLVQTNTLLAPQ